MGGIIYLCIAGLFLALAAKLWHGVFVLSRLRKSGVITEGRCTHHEWGEDSVGAVFEYATPDGRTFTVSSGKEQTLPFEMSARTDIVYDPAKPSRSAVTAHLAGELRTLWMSAFAVTAVPIFVLLAMLVL
ncbi:DUF3592 domain-containing protein [Streptomyces griseocarneus]|uniref:DUF3592 domain-containing protein n=1 Tax=Streptomyces griseocarneus TaxID=51201 RepID=UPI00167CD8CF|nr:DUF3592 domain-containing protein [Streptomyces griseocarneus]MBZ6476966.1 DUF3592 domain-containing protein [Streptomyces griseocarneus]GHG76445.1 hypothetical protein GCM10018779_54760 [Streptomyces griseocarneus]